MKQDEDDIFDAEQKDYDKTLKALGGKPFKKLPKGSYDLNSNIPKNKKLSKIDADIKKLRDKREIEEAREEPILKRTNNGIYNKTSHTFWKVFAIFCFLALITFGILAFYTDTLDGFIKPQINNTIVVNNEFQNEFQNEVNNDYDHTINVNITNYNNIITP